VFLVVMRATSARVTPRSSATFSATNRTRAGSLRRPRLGGGERKGLSVSTRSIESGTVRAASCTAAALWKVTMPEKDTWSPSSTTASAKAGSPEKQ